MNPNYPRTLLAAALSAALVSPLVMAQEDGLTLEEVIVTAEKRDASIQDVSMSITAISGTTLEDLAIRSFDDVVEIIPGISISNPGTAVGNRNIGIRGIITQSGSWLVGENTVGFYIDDVPIPVSDPRLVDLQRVEVLRGPQGTLYGSSTLGGLMKLVTVKPSFEEFNGHVSAEYETVTDGDTGHDFEGSINIPLADNFAIRVSGYVEEEGGYIDYRPIDFFGFTAVGPDQEDYNPVDNKGIRASAYWEINDKFRAQLSYMMNEIEYQSTTFADSFAVGASDDDFVALGRDGFFADQTTEFDLVSLELEYDFENFSVTMINAIFENDSNTLNVDFTETFGFLSTPMQVTLGSYDHRRDEFSHETRITSTWDKNWNFVAGFFYNDREQEYVTRFPQEPGTVIDLSIFLGLPPGTLALPNPPDGFVFRSDSTRLVEETAIYGELSYDFNEQWSVAVGLRAFEYETELFDDFGGNPALITGAILEGDSEADDVIGRIRGEFKPDEDLLLYASASEGFRTGGSNFPLPRQADSCAAELRFQLGTDDPPLQYESDSLIAYELGAKKTWADGRVTTNFALFRTEWEDIQVQVSPLCALNGSVFNAGEATSQGFEFEMAAQVTENLYMAGGVSYTDAEFTEDVSFGGNFIFASDGSLLPDVPELTYSLQLMYDVNIRDNIDGFIRGTYSYRDERPTLPVVRTVGGATQQSIKEEYSLLNLRIGAVINDQWTIALFGDNLTNDDPSLLGAPADLRRTGLERGGFVLDQTLRPRTIGAQVRFDF